MLRFQSANEVASKAASGVASGCTASTVTTASTASSPRIQAAAILKPCRSGSQPRTPTFSGSHTEAAPTMM